MKATFQSRLQDGSAEPLTPRSPSATGLSRSNSGDGGGRQQQAAPSPAVSESSSSGVKAQLLKLLADARLDEKSIWEGDAAVFACLRQWSLNDPSARDRLLRGDAGSGGAPGKHVVLFNFPPLPEFGGVQRKSYVINPLKPIHQVVRLLCQRAQPQDGVAGSAVVAARCGLATLRGFVMDDAEVLAAYGLGTLFTNWELNVVPKPQQHLPLMMPTPPRPAAAAAPQQQQQQGSDASSRRSTDGGSVQSAGAASASPPPPLGASPPPALSSSSSNSTATQAAATPSSAGGLVTFEFPELPELQGLRSKMLHVDLYSPLSRVIESVCRRYRVPSPDRFVLTTVAASAPVAPVAAAVGAAEPAGEANKKDKSARGSWAIGDRLRSPAAASILVGAARPPSPAPALAQSAPSPRAALPEVVLDNNATLAMYGLGTRMQRWHLKLQLRSEVNGLPVDTLKELPELRWTQTRECQAEPDELRRLVAAVDDRLAARAQETAQLAARLSEIEADSARREAQLEAVAAENETLQLELLEARRTHAELRDALTRLTRTQETLQANSTVLQMGLEQAEAELTAERSAHKALQDKYNELQEIAIDEKTLNIRSKKRIEELREQLAKSQAELHDLRQDFDQAKQLMRTARDEWRHTEARLLDEASRRQAQLDDSVARLDYCQAQLRDAQAAHQRAVQEASDARREALDADTAVRKVYAAEKATLQEQIRVLQAELAEANTTSEPSAAPYQEQLATFRSLDVEASERLAQANEQDIKEQAILRLQSTLETATARETQLQQQLLLITEEKMDLQAQVTAIIRDKKQLETEVERARVAEQKLEAQLEQVQRQAEADRRQAAADLERVRLDSDELIEAKERESKLARDAFRLEIKDLKDKIEKLTSMIPPPEPIPPPAVIAPPPAAPPPPPPKTLSSSGSLRSSSGSSQQPVAFSLERSILEARSSLKNFDRDALRESRPLAPRPPASIAEVLFAALQSRFRTVNDDNADELEFDAILDEVE